MINIAAEQGGRLAGQAQIDAAKVVADFLDREDDIPWPVQLRAVEALAAMRQGFDPSRPKNPQMATAAMRLLADPEARPEVRAEAARALGLMPITTAVPRYNYSLIGYSAGQLAAELGHSVAKNRPTNDAKAKYVAALLIGPVYQAFDGVPSARDSGILHTAPSDSAAYIQKVFDLVKPVVGAVLELLNCGKRQIPEKQKDLLARVDALKSLLKSNPPPDRRLVPNGVEFPVAFGPAAAMAEPAKKLAGPRTK